MSTRLGLGTVQFGTPYGVANSQDVPSLEEVARILATARQQGVTLLDTATLYGNSEAVLGQCDLSGFSIVTKTPRFNVPAMTVTQADYLQRTFMASLEHLKQPAVYGLLSHHADDLLADEGELLWQAMTELKQKKQVEKIGASIYTGEQIDQLMQRYPLEIVQIPLNVIDQRLITGGQLERLRAAGIEVHVRSIFLQGLLLMDKVPAYFEPMAAYLAQWKRAALQQQMTLTQAALTFVRDLPGVSAVLVGVVNVEQLLAVTADFQSKMSFKAADLACNIPALVDPSQWNFSKEAAL